MTLAKRFDIKNAGLLISLILCFLYSYVNCYHDHWLAYTDNTKYLLIYIK